MVQAVYVLLMAAGMAIAWRSNPMYTFGRTVRFLLVCAGSIGLYVAAIIAVMHITAGASSADAAGALALTVLLGTMFFIWSIVTVSTPRPPKPAAAIPLVFRNRAHVMPWFGRLFIALMSFAILAFALRGSARDVFLALGGIAVFLAIILVFTLYIVALGMDRSLTSVEANAWIHWRYDAAAWSAFRAALVARTAEQPRSWIWSRDWKKAVGLLLAIGVAMSALDLLAIPLPFIAVDYAGCAVLLLGFFELSARMEARAPERLRRFLMNAPPETYAGDAGIFCDGAYVQWITPANYLVSAAIDERAPRSAVFTFEQISAGAPSTTFAQTVLLPPAPEADLRVLQARLAQRCPSAAIALA